jgi:hypothetical protein
VLDAGFLIRPDHTTQTVGLYLVKIYLTIPPQFDNNSSGVTGRGHEESLVCYDQLDSGQAIKHIAMICNLSDWKSVNMAMLTAAFDCSKDRDRKYFIMAGFVSSADEWVSFDAQWRARLAADGLAYFHMQPFSHANTHPKKPFDKTWIGQEQRRQDLMKDLLDIVKSHAWRKVACILPVNVLDTVTLDARRYFFPSLIATAGSLLWTEIEAWRCREKFRNQAEMIFERGDEHQGTLIDMLTQGTGNAPILRYKKDNPAKGIVGFTPLQAADILAFEIQKIAQLEGGPLPTRFRVPYEQIDKIPGEIRIFTEMGAKIQATTIMINEYFKTHPLGSEGVH